MPEIKLNSIQRNLMKAAELMGKKSFVNYDLLFNYITDKETNKSRWVITNAHTGDEFEVIKNNQH